MKPILTLLVFGTLALASVFVFAPDPVSALGDDPEILAQTSFQDEGGDDEEAKKHKFIGTKNCKLCHMRSSVGGQYKKWSKNAHAKAYKTLASDEAKKIADERGLGDPQKEDECLRCHVTGHGVDEKLLDTKKGYKAKEGVTCESCHGPASDYYGEENHSEEFGMIKPDEKTCLKCHNEESPTFKGFDHKEYWAKIEHMIPKDDK